MGKEAACRATIGKRAGNVKAHLDSTALKLSGDLRLTVAFAEMSAVVARAGSLAFSSPAGDVVLELGEPFDARWAYAILNPKSRLQKLGIVPGQLVCVVRCESEFTAEIEATLGVAPAAELRGTFDAIFEGVTGPDDIACAGELATHLKPNGALWFVHAKGRGAIVTEGAVREAIRSAGLVDTKIVAFSATHTATKAVIPLAARRP
jgi:hypothetical protein